MEKNIIMIMGDQLRYDVLGKGFTPNIDALMDDSVRFENAYTACPLCIPARGALMTGTHPSHNGAIVNPWGLLDDRDGLTGEAFENIFQKLEETHYSVHCGKQHFFTAPEKLEDRKDSRTRFVALERDFDEHVQKEGYKPQGGMEFKIRVPEMIDGRRTAIRRFTGTKTALYEGGFDRCFDAFVLRHTLQELKQRDKSKPLFLSAMFLSPHPPLHAPEPYYSSVSYDDFTMPENIGINGDLESPLALYSFSAIAGIGKTREDWKEPWRVYLGLVKMLDDCVGEIVQELKKEGLYDESVIFFSSDHGEMMGSHCMWQKMNMYEESIKVPFSIKFPASEKLGGKQIDMPVSGIDLYPTLCDYLGVPVKNNVDGVSLMPLIKGEPFERGLVFSQYDGNGGISNQERAVIDGKYKLIASWFQQEFFLELYDVKKDSQELHNLAFCAEQKDTVLRLLDALETHLRDTGDMLRLPKEAYGHFLVDYAFML